MGAKAGEHWPAMISRRLQREQRLQTAGRFLQSAAIKADTLRITRRSSAHIRFRWAVV
jgi:hypothetical protein